MQGITTRQFQALTDMDVVWRLMTDCYQPCCENGMAAPFFEYALTSSWFDARYVYLNRLWFVGEKAVGFVFYESPVTSIFFHLLPGYEALAGEMIAYADEQMPGASSQKELVLFPGQKALIKSAEERGYQLAYTSEDHLLDFSATTLDRPLPAGFRFVEPEQVDAAKLAACTWKGFDHEDKGPFENWDAEEPDAPWSPQKAYRGVAGPMMAPPPHATYEHNVIIADEKGEYVCFCGMWWVPENHLAYMEPLCTVPEYRGRGLAAAALSEHWRRMKKLGAEYMTGGDADFYRKVGYTSAIRWMHWKRQA